MPADANDPRVRRLSEQVLRAGGSVSLALLLEQFVAVAELRRLAQEFGLSPKGFRIDRAPARVLGPLLAELGSAERLERAVELLVARLQPPDAAAAATAPMRDADQEAQATLRWQEQEIERLRHELERAREGAARGSERESALRRQVEHYDDQLQLLRGELHRARQAHAAPGVEAAAGDRDLQRRVRELEHEIEARAAADEALRRQLAVERTRVRELEDEIAELLPLVPKGRRRKAPPPPPEPARRFVLPHFHASFYRSLEGKDRKSVERALQAVLLFCTEGYGYPGLEVKRMGGQDTWSLRASRGLRVYFQQRADGDVEFLELADREEQNTTLRRLKER